MASVGWAMAELTFLHISADTLGIDGGFQPAEESLAFILSEIIVYVDDFDTFASTGVYVQCAVCTVVSL